MPVLAVPLALILAAVVYAARRAPSGTTTVFLCAIAFIASTAALVPFGCAGSSDGEVSCVSVAGVESPVSSYPLGLSVAALVTLLVAVMASRSRRGAAS